MELSRWKVEATLFRGGYDNGCRDMCKIAILGARVMTSQRELRESVGQARPPKNVGRLLPVGMMSGILPTLHDARPRPSILGSSK